MFLVREEVHNMINRDALLRWFRNNSLIIKTIKRMIKNPVSIVMINGGICSQMQQYLIGAYLSEKGQTVAYDLSFYDTYKLNGVNTRNFDLLKLFPALDFNIASPLQVKLYRKLFEYHPNEKSGKGFEQIPKSPVYVNGYYDVGKSMYNDFGTYFPIDIENIGFDEGNKKFYEMILHDDNSVGVHVRRGDMKVVGNYWKVLRPLFYKQAMDKFDFSCTTFYFFSDERDWISDNILPLFQDEIKYVFVDCNESDRGYLDLVLLSVCRHQIASQGSFGKYAWLLNKYDEKCLVVPNCGIANELIETSKGKNIIFIELNQDNCENP